MKLLVCGGRNFNYYEFVRDTLDRIMGERGYSGEYGVMSSSEEVILIHGKAKGADDCADQWAVVNWLQIEEYPADWKQHGKKAGYLRNKQMLEEGKPDLIVAFPGGKGTANMISLGRKAGVEVVEITKEN